MSDSAAPNRNEVDHQNADTLDSSFLSGANATFIAEMSEAWRQNPRSVDAAWASYFEQLEAAGEIEERGPSWGNGTSRVVGAIDPEASIKAVAAAHKSNGSLNAGNMRAATLDSLRAVMLIRAYRIRGHLLAKLDPLALEEPELHPELDPKAYGFDEDDWDRPIFINYVLGLETATLREIIDVLRKTYCGTIGVEFMHVQDPAQKAWIQER
ncbi:MAG: 2-oxoglutarate dehydrogenase E1 subunit family protein, partial [Candidatus Puniceispirillum sp.]